MVERVLDLMKENELNGVQLSLLAGLSKGAVSEWKCGKKKPGTDAIVKLAKHFDVSTDYLLGLTDERTVAKIGTVDNMKLKVKGNTNIDVRQDINNGLVAATSSGRQCELTDDAAELLDIYSGLKVRKRVDLLQYMYKLKEEQDIEASALVKPAPVRTIGDDE